MERLSALRKDMLRSVG